MKKYLVITLLFLWTNSDAQSKIVEDTLFYSDRKFVVGDTLQLWYGSAANKDFAFVYIGSGLSGVNLAPAAWSKSMVKIDKVYKTQGKYYARGKVLDAALLGSKLFIDIEGAVDNKELK